MAPRLCRPPWALNRPPRARLGAGVSHRTAATQCEPGCCPRLQDEASADTGVSRAPLPPAWHGYATASARLLCPSDRAQRPACAKGPQHQATMHDKSHCYFSLQMACVAKSDEGCRLRKPKFWQNAVRVIGQNAHSPRVSRTQRTSWLLRGGSAAAAPRSSLGSGARAAARRRAAVCFCGDGCCAAAVPLPRLAASHQRRSSRGALARSPARPRR